MKPAENFIIPPAAAVTVWTTGDKLMIQFEGHTVDIPVDEPRRLVTVLKAREAKGRRSTIGEAGAPPQLIIYDAYKEALDKQSADRRAAALEKAAAKEAAAGKAATKRYEKGLKQAEIDEMLRIAELAGL
jgi:hypothetical protein